MAGAHRRLTTYAVVGLALAVVIGVLSLGPRVAPFGLISPLRPAEPLDYSSRPAQRITPLSGHFVESVLGAGAGERSTAGAAPARGRGPTLTVPAFADRVTDVHPLTNDDIVGARHIPSVPFTAKTDTRNATRESGEPDACAAVGSSTVWYRYTPPSDIGLIANTFASDYATALGVFRGAPGRLVLAGCDTDANGSALVALAAKKGATYYFQITGPTGGGDLVFNLDPRGITTVDSIDPTGARATTAGSASMSFDGRYVAFEADPYSEGVTGCPNVPLCTLIYVRDRVKKTTTVASINSSGQPAQWSSYLPYISGNGRYVAFESRAGNLVPGDTNEVDDIFVHDLKTRRTKRVSVTSSGAQLPPTPDEDGRTGAYEPSISADGRYVAFATKAALVPEDHNGEWDIYVNDGLTKETERVSVANSGADRGPEATNITNCTFCDGLVMNGSISPNGRYVRFQTSSKNLTPDDKDEMFDTFVRDRVAKTTELVSYRSGRYNIAASGNEFGPRQSFSSDGRYVVFVRYISGVENVEFSPESTYTEINVFDRETRRTFVANVSSTGRSAERNADSRSPAISADGRYVAFHSEATNLVPGDTNGSADVFVHDLLTRTTIRISAADTGAPSERASTYPFLSADGRLIAYASQLEQTAPGPTVGARSRDSTVYVFERPPTFG